MKAWLLKLHRWITLATAIPLAVIIVTGGILSLEPILYDNKFTGRSIPLAKVEAALTKHDPGGRAGALIVRSYENTIGIAAGRGTPPTMIDLDTGEKVGDRRLWSDFFTTSRRLHEHLLIEQKWIVDYATVAMLVSMILGLFMGWMRFRNSLGGWHRTVALVTAPLLIVTALTGLAIAWGITFAPPPAGAPTTAAGAAGAREQITLRRAVQIVANSHDLASVVWIRPMSGGLRARIYDGREANIFAVTERGLTPGNRNWPRALHEGVWAGAFSGLLNLLISLVLAGLMMTGLTIWARRTLRRWVRAP